MTIVLALLCVVLPLFFHTARSLEPLPYRIDIDSGRHGSYPVHEFISTRLRAPQVNFLQWHPECDDGLYYFLTPRGWKVSDPGPMILDAAGNLIWSKHFDNKFGGQAYDLKVQKYLGEDYLTFWLGDDTIRGHGAGSYYMVGLPTTKPTLACTLPILKPPPAKLIIRHRPHRHCRQQPPRRPSRLHHHATRHSSPPHLPTHSRRRTPTRPQIQ